MNRKSGLLWLALLAALPLPAKIYYFATTGSDSNPCTSAQPCKSFNALNNFTINSGDTMLALDGVDFDADQSASYIFNVPVTIDGGEHGAFMTGPNNSNALYVLAGSANTAFVVRNVTITVGQNGAQPAAGIYLNLLGGAFTLDHVTIISQNAQGNALTGVLYGGAVHLNGVNILGQGNGINLSNISAIGGSTSGGAFPFTAENVTVDVTGAGMVLTDLYGTIRNSKFRSGATNATGLSLQSSVFATAWLLDTCSFENLSYGLVVGGGITARISNSEFSGNGFGIFSGGTTISFRNNVFAGNGSDGSPSLSTSLK